MSWNDYGGDYERRSGYTHIAENVPRSREELILAVKNDPASLGLDDYETLNINTLPVSSKDFTKDDLLKIREYIMPKFHAAPYSVRSESDYRRLLYILSGLNDAIDSRKQNTGFWLKNQDPTGIANPADYMSSIKVTETKEDIDGDGDVDKVEIEKKED